MDITEPSFAAQKKKKKKSRAFYVDQNKFRVPFYLFLPTFHTVNAMHLYFNLAAIGLLKDRSGSKLLLDFAAGRVDQSFRINPFMAQDTSIFVRSRHSSLS